MSSASRAGHFALTNLPASGKVVSGEISGMWPKGNDRGRSNSVLRSTPRAVWVRGGDCVGGASSLENIMRVYPSVERWSLWGQSWNYETKFVTLNNGEVLRLDYRPPLQWLVRKDVPTKEGWTTSVVFNGLGNPEGNLQSVVRWGRRLWHEGQRRVPLRLDIRITGRADDQLQALRPGACKIAQGSFSTWGGMNRGEVWSEPDGFGGWLCWLRRSNRRRKERSPRWFCSAYPAVPERMFGAMVRCSGIRTRDHMTRVADALLLESSSYQRDDEAIEAAIARVGGTA